MELLSFMCSRKLSSTSVPLVVDVPIAADKLEVASCTRHCMQSVVEEPFHDYRICASVFGPPFKCLHEALQLVTSFPSFIRSLRGCLSS